MTRPDPFAAEEAPDRHLAIAGIALYAVNERMSASQHFPWTMRKAAIVASERLPLQREIRTLQSRGSREHPDHHIFGRRKRQPILGMPKASDIRQCFERAERQNIDASLTI